jgi:ADP-heptose:LPS heptosyltransferase
VTAPKKTAGLLARHWSALVFICTVVLPVIVRTGRRPVVFSRWSGMGDIICTFPAALELKKRHPGATFIYNCHPDFAVMASMGGVANLCTHYLHLGVAGYWYRFLFAGFYHFAHGDDMRGKTSKESMVTEFCHQFNLPVQTEHPRLTIVPEFRDQARLILKRKNLGSEGLIILHPGPSWPVREWPLEKWAELVAGLRQRGYANIVQLGVSRHTSFEKVAAAAIPDVASLVDELSLEQASALISLAKLHIGIDSGLLHIAAAVGTPGVGIFGMTSPHTRFSQNYIRSFVTSRVECQGCYHRLPRVDWITGCPNDIKCMKEISPHEVLQACLTVLETQPT